MARRVVLHVGTMKTGTTYVQTRMYTNREQLRERGVLVPGRAWPDQVRGVRDVLALARDQPSPYPGAWQALVDEAAAFEGTAWISMEFLANVRPRVAAFVGSTLPGVEVVVTARDLNRTLPAMWQTSLRNGFSWTWEDYLRGARDHRPGAERSSDGGPRGPEHFWKRQDLVRVVRTWSGQLPTTLVTVPPPGAPHEVIWQRMCQVVGVEPSLRSLEGGGMNESLGLATCLMLRRLNELLDAMGSPWQHGENIRRQFLGRHVLPLRTSAEPSLGLPVTDWVRDTSARMRAQLQELGVPVVGDLADLVPHDVPGTSPDQVDAAAVADAAFAALAAVVDRDAQLVADPSTTPVARPAVP